MIGLRRLRSVSVLVCWASAAALLQAQSPSVADGGGAVAAPPEMQPGATAEVALARRSPVVDPEATLEVWNRQIVVFRATLFSRPADRAEKAAQRLRALATAQLSEPVRTTPAEVSGKTGILVAVGDTILFGLVAEDVDVDAGETLQGVAASAAERLRAALDARIRQRNPGILLRGALRSLAATLIVAAIVFVVSRARKAWMERLGPSPGAFGTALRVGDVDYGVHVARLLRWLVTAVAWLLRLAVAYLWLTFILSQFPLTEPWSATLGHWLYGTIEGLLRSAVDALPGLATAILILLGARGVARILGSTLDGIAQGQIHVAGAHPETARATRRIVVVLVWLFGIALAYPFLPGSQSASFQGISVLLGLMLSLGSAGLLNHLMAGWVITYSRSVRQGDYITLGGVDGTVVEVGALALKVVTRRGEEVTVPNAVVTGNLLTNYTRRSVNGGMVGSTSVTIGYDAPWRQVHAMLQAAADRTTGIAKSPKPRVLQRALADFYPEYELVFELEPGVKRADALTELHGHIQDVFNEHGVQIMSPNFVAQPDRPVVVPKSAWFSAPAVEDPRS